MESSNMKILVCGGRDFTNKEFIWATLDELHAMDGISMIVHGNARGVDKIAGDWGKEMGIPVITVDANWDFYKKAAGHIRNHWMLQYVPVDQTIAFPGGPGTASTIALSHKLLIPVREITY